MKLMWRTTLLTIAFSLTLFHTSAAAQILVDVALEGVGTGSTAELRGRIFNTPLTVLGPEFRTRAMGELPESIRRNRIAEGKLLRRVERVIKPLLVLHDRTKDLELFLYHGDTLRGMLWRGCVLEPVMNFASETPRIWLTLLVSPPGVGRRAISRFSIRRFSCDFRLIRPLESS